jgi:RNA polymerase sigma factor (sigma-70 family)
MNLPQMKSERQQGTPSDAVLIGQLADGDQSALESLYDRHSTLLYSVALRIAGDSRNAEEILQDTFLQLWRKASQFESARGSLIGWLLAITRHRAISRIREKNHRFYRASLCADDITLPGNTGSSVLDQQIARELVSVALEGLPQVQRETITLAYFDGLTCEEIAVRTTAPLGTIKGRLRSALKAMKKSLSNAGVAISPKSPQAPGTLEDILITDQLASRPRRHRSSEQETKALRALGQVAADCPSRLIDCFLQMPIDLCRAGTAGLSFLETNPKGEQVFRWTNLAGQLEEHVGGTTPRNFSPCGVTLDRGSPQLFAYPGRYFNYFNRVKVPIVEALVIPFHVGAMTEGTLWVVSHKEGIQFDSEDVRIMTTLAEFAGCALHLMKLLDAK